MKDKKDWQPIETAPKNCEAVLVQHVDDLYPVVGFLIGGVWNYETDGPEDDVTQWPPHKYRPLLRPPTHWMPLPDPPQESLPHA